MSTPHWPVDLMWRFDASEIVNEHAVAERGPAWPVDLMWRFGASEIVNEHALEEGAHPMVASDSAEWLSKAA